MNPKTNAELVHKVEILNKKYFGNRLRVQVAFAKKPSMCHLGLCSYNRATKISTISINPLLKGYDLTETLLHECCHADNFQTLGTSSHGKEFKEVAHRIYKTSNGRYNICGHCTDKKLNEVVTKYAKEKRRINNAKKFNMTLSEYDKWIKEILAK